MHQGHGSVRVNAQRSAIPVEIKTDFVNFVIEQFAS
jgi:hypothetical protein